MAPRKQQEDTGPIPYEIRPLLRGKGVLRLIGTMPMYQNRMAEKAKQTLLVGGARKGAADRAHVKHHPLEEFRSAAEILPDGPTAIGLKVRAIKGAMAEAALATPGLNKVDVHRFVYLPNEFVPLYGRPYLKMDVVRQAGMNRTPDIRTRAFFQKWAAEVEFSFVTPQLSRHSVLTLLYNAGEIVGIGDDRIGKGGSRGGFRVIGDTQPDAEWDEIVRFGRQAQLEALNTPQFVEGDRDTKELMEFFASETRRRDAGTEPGATRRTKTKATKAKLPTWEPGMPVPALERMHKAETEGVA
jgi:hypothetical protein